MGKIGLTLMPALDWNIIKNLAIENESNANLFITELNEKAENALDNRLIDVSDLTKEELYYHLSSIIPLFCFFKYRTDLEKYLKSIFERSVNLNLLLNQKIDIKLLYSTINNLEDDKRIVIVLRNEALRLTYQYIDSLIKFFLIELIFPAKNNTNLIAKEFKLINDLYSGISNKIIQKKIRGKTKERLVVINSLFDIQEKTEIKLDWILKQSLDFAKGKRNALDKMYLPNIINCVVFVNETSEYSASKLLIPLVSLICKSTDFSVSEDEWLSKTVSADKSYHSYCYKYLVNQFYR